VITELGTKVTFSDFVVVDGEPVKSTTHLIYILLNKPKDYITTTKDEKGRKTVLDIVKKKERIFPVGRLDRNSTGALLLTNDGDLAYRLTHPKFEIPKEYHASLDKKLTENHAKTISKGIDLDGEITAPCELFINPEDYSQVILILKEGKNREIRKIFESLGYEVMKLDRKYFAGISTKGLSRGEYRHLTHREILSLKKLVKL
jgi:23S rRNA pseudouridine2605 synthase